MKFASEQKRFATMSHDRHCREIALEFFSNDLFQYHWKQWWIAYKCPLMRTLNDFYLKYEYRLHKILNSEISLSTKSMSLQKCVFFYSFALNTYLLIYRETFKNSVHICPSHLTPRSSSSIIWDNSFFESIRLDQYTLYATVFVMWCCPVLAHEEERK